VISPDTTSVISVGCYTCGDCLLLFTKRLGNVSATCNVSVSVTSRSRPKRSRVHNCKCCINIRPVVVLCVYISGAVWGTYSAQCSRPKVFGVWILVGPWNHFCWRPGSPQGKGQFLEGTVNTTTSGRRQYDVCQVSRYRRRHDVVSTSFAHRPGESYFGIFVNDY